MAATALLLVGSVSASEARRVYTPQALAKARVQSVDGVAAEFARSTGRAAPRDPAKVLVLVDGRVSGLPRAQIDVMVPVARSVHVTANSVGITVDIATR